MKFRILGYVAAIVVASSTAQAETIRQMAVVKIGEAMGLAAKCSSLELDSAKIQAAVDSSGLAVKGLMDEAFAVAEKVVVKLQGSEESKVCEIGRTLYGPDGQKAKGFLKPK
jgi:hypothetical protein